MTSRRARWFALAAVAFGVAAVGAGCGGSDDEQRELPPEVQEILTQAEDVRRDEVFISGFRSPRVYGPYTFKSGGYVVRYEQSGERSNEQPLVVQVLRERDGRPLAVAVRATADAGKADVEVSGRVFVRVQSGRRYTLRFTPRR